MVTHSPGQQPVIEITGLSKVFKDFWLRPRVTAVDNLNLSVMPHEIFGLLGPNGSGKSTTIKIILGLLFPTKGRVSVFGKLPSDVITKRRIGYLPEESYLYRFLNARETLDYYGRLFGLERRVRIKRIDELLEMVGLDAVQRRPVGEYSKGMQRLIGIAQALINNPDLLILDEPTSGLDPLGSRRVKDLILHMRHEKKKTILLCSHFLSDVEDVCDRLCILYGGKKRAEGTVDELLTVSDSTLIETDTLRLSTIQKIEELVEREEGRAIRKVEAPRQKLETLFINIVEQAQREGVATAGVAAGGEVAGFLTEQTEGDAVIDQLISGKQIEAAPEKPTRGKPEAVASAPEVERTVIDQLTQTRTVPVDQTDDADAPQSKSPDSNVDSAVLDDLLGGGDKPAS